MPTIFYFKYFEILGIEHRYVRKGIFFHLLISLDSKMEDGMIIVISSKTSQILHNRRLKFSAEKTPPCLSLHLSLVIERIPRKLVETPNSL